MSHGDWFRVMLANPAAFAGSVVLLLTLLGGLAVVAASLRGLVNITFNITRTRD